MGVLNYFRMADCGPTEFFKIADLLITDDLYRPATVHEEEKRSKENSSWGTLLRPRFYYVSNTKSKVSRMSKESCLWLNH